jgi:hypothetical protein
MSGWRVTIAALLLGATACTDAARDGGDQLIVVSDVGFQTPESVLHDSVADVYFVSNINGSPFAADGNGFISRIGPDGVLLELKWIDGQTAGVTLHAPKGMALRGDTLFVTDITAVRLFHRESGDALGSWAVRGATFLNDVAVDTAGTVYVSDSGLRASANGFEPSGTDAVYRFDPDGTPLRLTAGETLGHPNGLAAGPGRLVLVSFGSGAMFQIHPESGQTSGLPRPPAGQLDGVVRLESGSLLVSSWEAKAVYRMGPGAQFTAVVENVEAPADIGYDRARERILIPLFTTNQVHLVPLPRVSSVR